MTLTTPAPERDSRFSCPNPSWAQCNRPGAGHMVHRSWTGQDKPSARLRCPVWSPEFSEREGILMSRRKLPEDTVIRLVQGQRWGVCDAGPADMCDVELTTVQRVPRVAAPRAEPHHRQSVPHVEVAGGQLDEAPAKLRPQQVAWGHTAWAMGRWLLLGGDFGPRPQGTAATLIAQVMARTRQRSLLLMERWTAPPAALLQVVGRG